MNRRQAVKGIAAATAVAIAPSLASAERNAYGWPDRVTLGTTPGAKNARPYLHGRRVYGAYDGCVSEGWVDATRMEPDNFTEGAKSMSSRRAAELGHASNRVRLHGRLEFRTVNPDGSWPD